MEQSERYEPLPPISKLPRWAWGRLPQAARRALAVAAVLGLAGLAVAVPEIQEGKREGEAAREAADRRADAARRRELVEDQRPRTAPVPTRAEREARRVGGLADAGAAATVGALLEHAITTDVRGRVRAGTLPGPAPSTECTPVRIRTVTQSSYNCLALSARRETGGRTLSVGYRFRAQADLVAGLLIWCKENPPPLHPTSFVISVPRSPRCP